MSFDLRTDSARLGDFPFHVGIFDQEMRLRISTYRCLNSPGTPPIVSFVIPVHNQANSIRSNLDQVVTNAQLDSEFLILVDGCSDSTLDVIHGWASAVIDGLRAPRIAAVTVVEIPEGVYETICDSIGITLAGGTYVVEIQADMCIQHAGFDNVMVSALKSNDDVFMIGGRGAHSFRRLVNERQFLPRVKRRVRETVGSGIDAALLRLDSYTPSMAELRVRDQIGRMGGLMELRLSGGSSDFLYLHETTMRGPIAMSRHVFSDLGGFDTGNFFLGNDEHDLALRAWMTAGLRTAYLPVTFSSPLAAGSTRAVKSSSQVAKHQYLMNYYNNRFSLSFLGQNLGSYNRPPVHRRRLSLPSQGAIGTLSARSDLSIDPDGEQIDAP